MRFLAILLFSAFFCWPNVKADASNGGHQISIELKNYDEPQLFLGYHYGDKQYLQDTVEKNKAGFFVFEGEEPLSPGVYLVVMAPDNKYFQLLVTDEEQNFKVFVNAENPTQEIRFENAPDNQLFYEYLSFLEEKKPMADQLAEQITAAEDDSQRKALQDKRSKIDEEVKDFQASLIRRKPGSLTAAIIKANLPLDTPEFEGTEEEIQLKRWRYSQDHYFDNLDLGDPRMLRTPFLFQRVDYFVHKLQVQHPDTISWAIDQVLERMKPAEETFKYYLIHFLNEYAKSNIVGMDAVYVHLVNKYYATGMAPWTDEEQLEKIIENAKALEPLLIGKIAPNIKLQKRDGSPIELYDVESEYTILYFWRYDCGHCKKSTPFMKEFYEKYKDKGVKIVAVCAKFTDEIPDCWKYIDDNEIGDWLHTVDEYHRSRFMTVYNIKSTPQLYILDRNKEILSKRIGAEQLEEVMDKIIEMREKEGKE
ncbi:MAG: redoxin domain-containing protein [Lewinellaceae bacterium]|nr:redoxin domain-containing protein [Phaeodactylibacter sp.]MCB9350802.1 redoxin domain-containing protein [Lewinellaceae bacterium]